jgi:hypothetical protein
LAFQRDPDENGGRETKTPQIKHRLIAADKTFFLQHLLPPGDRRAREPDALGEVDLACPGIDGKLREDSRIDMIDLHVFGFLRQYRN